MHSISVLGLRRHLIYTYVLFKIISHVFLYLKKYYTTSILTILHSNCQIFTTLTSSALIDKVRQYGVLFRVVHTLRKIQCIVVSQERWWENIEWKSSSLIWKTLQTVYAYCRIVNYDHSIIILFVSSMVMWIVLIFLTLVNWCVGPLIGLPLTSSRFVRIGMPCNLSTCYSTLGYPNYPISCLL